MRVYIILFLFLLAAEKFGQNFDSLYNYYMSLHNTNHNIKENSIQHVHEYTKCGLEISMQIKYNFDRFTPAQQLSLKNVMSRPNKQTSRVSPSGYFRIHYDTTGSEIPMYFTDTSKTKRELIEMSIDSLAVALDSSYNYEVNILGYPEPPSDGIKGGDDKYDIYIKSFSKNTFGDTYPYKISFIRIENDFKNFRTSGMKAVKATAAHEFHHAIQLGNYSTDIEHRYMFEMTSTSMEEFVYDEANDYYYDLKKYFKSPGQRIDATWGYDKVLWWLFIVEKLARDRNDEMLGHKIIKRSWELFKETDKAMKAISEALAEEGYSFKQLFNEFGTWCYFTGNKAEPDKYFEEGEYYPQVKPLPSFHFDESIFPITISSNPVSNNFRGIVIDSGDTLITIVTNADIQSIDNNAYELIPFELNASKNYIPNYLSINDEIYANVSTSFNNLISESYIFRNQVIENYDPDEIDFPFPQPFHYSQNKELFIPATNNINELTSLFIFTVSMDLVYSSENPNFSNPDFDVVEWNGLSKSGEKLPTGVYIYVTKTGNKIKKGKFVIYND